MTYNYLRISIFALQLFVLSLSFVKAQSPSISNVPLTNITSNDDNTPISISSIDVTMGNIPGTYEVFKNGSPYESSAVSNTNDNFSFTYLGVFPEDNDATIEFKFLATDASGEKDSAYLYISYQNASLTLRQRDSLVLVDMYNALNGPSWTNQSGWEIINGIGSVTPIDTWDGVVLSLERVQSIDLSSNNLVGTIPNSVINLSTLSSLFLGASDLSSINPAIGAITSLNILELNDCQLTGDVPKNIENLANLTEIYLQDNSLIHVDAVGALTNLTTLDASRNDITIIPNVIGNLVNLQTLRLRGNDFQLNTIPSTIGNLSSIVTIDIAANGINAIPPEMGNLSTLVNLDLNFNQIADIPNELSTLISLENLGLRANNLTGPLRTDIFSGMTSLQSINIALNQLTNIPSDIDQITSLVSLNITDNQLTGSVPASIINLPSFLTLSISNNELTELPNISASSLTTLNISDNRFTFEDLEPNLSIITSNTSQKTFGNGGNLEGGANTSFDYTPFETPFFQGSTDSYLWRFNGTDTLFTQISDTLKFTSLELANSGSYELIVTNSNFPGFSLVSEPIFLNVVNLRERDSLAMVALYQSTNGSGWNNKAGWEIIDGAGAALSIDQWDGVSLNGNRVTSLDVFANNLDGVLPAEVGDLDALQSFNLNSNPSLSGAIPEEFGNLVNLLSVNLNNVSITSIPSTFSNLLNATLVNIGSPLITFLPDEFWNMPALNDVRLSNNEMLSLTIPPEFGSKSNLQIFWVFGGKVMGDIPFGSANTSLSSLILTDAGIESDVPLDGLLSIPSLNQLYLYGNEFTTIPDFSSLSLSELKVENNRLTFDVLEPNAGLFSSNLDYAPQKNFGDTSAILAPIGGQVTLNANVPGNGVADAYQWIKNGVDIPGANQIEFTIESVVFEDYAAYQLKITSSVLANIELLSEPVYLQEGNQVTGNIKSDTTWTGLVSIDGPTFVEPGFTLTIEPGTIVKAMPGDGPFMSYLAVARGATINANGTPDQPIIFTSLRDEIKLGQVISPNLTKFDTKFWGGLYILGDAPISVTDGEVDPIETQIEGIPIENSLGLYGGSNPTSSSGSLQYISIRHGGLEFGPENESNGLTLAGVGSSTLVENIEVFASGDDGVSLFGGDVSINNALVLNSGDDAIDSDQDWIGTITDFMVLNPRGSALELDGPEALIPTPRGVGVFKKGIISAGPQIASLVDWDNNTNAEVSDVYFTNLESNYTISQGVATIQSFNGDSSALSSNWQADLPGGVVLDDVFAPNEALLITTEVVKGENTVGTNASLFDWTFAGITGELIDFGFDPTSLNREADSLGLVALYQSTNGTEWSKKVGWEIIDGVGSPLPIDQWSGITLSNNRVESIFLSNNNLSGLLPNEIGGFDALISLDLSQNQLVGNIPSVIGNLKNLQNLWLWFNQLSGNLPVELGELSSLRILDLNFNQLSGEIPWQLGNLSQLNVLNLPANQLTGEIPREFGNLTNLTNLWLDNNQLYGRLPSELTAIANLQTIQIINNQLDGEIDQAFADLPLSTFSITNNDFSSLPDFSASSFISTLEVSNNRLTFGDLEPNVGKITSNFGQKNFGKSYTRFFQDAVDFDGDSLFFDSEELGAGLSDTYQWFNNGMPIAGATSAILQLDNSMSFGSFYLEVNNSNFSGLTITSNQIFVNQANVISSNITTDQTWTKDEDYVLDGRIFVEPGVTLTIEPGTIVKASALGFDANNNEMFIAGEFNGWGGDRMVLIEDHVWAIGNIEVVGEWKFKNDFNWNGIDWSDTDCDGIAETNFGPNSNCGESGFFDITFNDQTLEYQFLEPGAVNFETQPPVTFLAVANGATINAIGTAQQPIIFTSVLDQVETRQISANLREFDKAFWGGLLILGDAPISDLDNSGTEPIEGILDPLGVYGGLDATDNSGTLRYVSIRHTGADIGNGNQINGLTLGGVGNGTIIDHVEVVAAFDDGIELFGGTVNVNNILVLSSSDDAIDTDQSFSGSINNFMVLSAADNAMELDGPEGTLQGGGSTITNGTIKLDGGRTSLLLKDNTDASISSIYFLGLGGSQPIEGYAAYSLNENGYTIANFEASIPDGNVVTDFFVDGSDAFVTEVIEFNNTVGADPLGFYWTYAFDRGFLDQFNVVRPAQTTLESDSLALVALYNATNGPDWNNQLNWLQQGSYVENWDGVEVLEGRVIALGLANNNLTGALPPELANLTALEYLDLGREGKGGNSLTGGFPEVLTSLTSLRGLGLASNQFSGPIPASFGNLTNLEQIDFTFNQFTELPPEIGDLTSLFYIGIAFNAFETLPEELYSLPAVDSLIISGNRLTGSIPEAIGNMTTLRYLNVGNNQFTGELPASFGNLTNLTGIRVWSMEGITGTIPTEWSNMIAISELTLSGLSLSGEIPAFLGALPALGQLNLSQNQFSGNVPQELLNTTTATYIALHQNAITTLPDFDLAPSFNAFLDVSRNRLKNAELDKLISISGGFNDVDQNSRYRIVQQGIASIGNEVLMSISDNEVTGSRYDWYFNNEYLETTDTLRIESFSNENTGVYTALIFSPNRSSGIYSNSVSLDVDETSRRYASSVISSSSSAKKIVASVDAFDYEAIETLGQPDLGGNFSYISPELGWVHNRNDQDRTIELSFDDPQPVNTVWLFGEASSAISSLEAFNPGTNEYDLLVGSVSQSERGLEKEINFPLTSYNVERIRLNFNFFNAITNPNANSSFDAIAIGQNDKELNIPELFLSQRVNDTILNLSWSFDNNSDSTSFSLERSTDGINFTEIVLRDRGITNFSDRGVPVVSELYYRVKAIVGGVESQYSNVLELISCPVEVATNNTWFGDADPNGFTGATFPQPNIQITRLTESSYEISDITAGYTELSSFGIPYTAIRANFMFDCDGVITAEMLNPPAGGCGGDLNFQLDSARYFADNDSLVFFLQWSSCGTSFRSFFKLNPGDRILPIQEPVTIQTISQPNNSSVEITWLDNNKEEDEFIIERSVDTENNYSVVGSSDAVINDPNFSIQYYGSFLDNTVEVGRTYFYRVITRNASGDSEFSNSLSITTQSDVGFERILEDPVVNDISNASYSGYWGDYDNDDDLDLYVTNWQKGSDPVFLSPRNYFYDNNGDGTFTKVSNALTAKETESRAGSWGDMDNDGDLDFVLMLNQNEINEVGQNLLLYENNGGNFTEKILGTPAEGGFDQVVLADLDNDGLLDIYSPGALYFNEGGNQFTEIRNEAAYPQDLGFSPPNVHFIDVDLDNDLDIYRGGDQGTILYINNGDRSFSVSDQLTTTDVAHRGGAWGDFDNDGDFDFFLTAERMPNNNQFRFFRNDDGIFKSLSPSELGLPTTLNLRRGATIIDYNNDGLLDLLSLESTSANPVILENIGNNQFNDIYFPSFTPVSSFTSAVTVADYNNDGSQDFFAASGFFTNQSNYLYRNLTGGNYLKVDLEGGLTNLQGIGARIKVIADGVPTQTKQVTAINGTWASNEITAHFGLRSATLVDSVIVYWPTGIESVVTDVAINQRIAISEIDIPVVTVDTILANNRSPQLTGKLLDPEASVVVSVDGNDYDGVNNGNGTWQLEAGIINPDLQDGVYDVMVQATNVIGTGTDESINELFIDATSPVVSVDFLDTEDDTPTITGKIDDPTAVLALTFDGVSGNYVPVNKMDGTWELNGDSLTNAFPDGEYDVIITATDTIGNISVDDTRDEFKLISIPPAVEVDFIGTSIRSPQLTGLIDDPDVVSFELELNGEIYSPSINEDSTWVLSAGTISPDLADGTYNVILRASDIWGHLGVDETVDEIFITTEIVALPASRITSTSFRANWSEPLDVISYEIDVSDQEDFSNLILAETGLSETNFVVEGLDFGTDYFYRVRYQNAEGVQSNSETVSLTTTVDPETIADFEALENIYSSTNGPEWTDQKSWNVARRQDWEGVSLENGRVVSLDLSNNGLSLKFPLERELTELRVINVSGNNLSDLDNLSRYPSINTLDVSGNQLQFDDLEPQVSIQNFLADNQEPLSFDQSNGSGNILVDVNTDTLITITASGSSINYDWRYQGGQVGSTPRTSINRNRLQIDAIGLDNMGSYSALLTSAAVPGVEIQVTPNNVWAVAAIEVNVIDSTGNPTVETLNADLLDATSSGSLDTVAEIKNQMGSFVFRDVVIGDFLLVIDPQTGRFIPTYYGNAFLWEEAATAVVRSDTILQIFPEGEPRERDENPETNPGTLDIVIFEDLSDESAGRIEARRKAARRKCGLRRRRTGGRIEQGQDGFELYAYGETNDDGEFEFGFLEQGTYRFFVEYPGIPLDQAAFVEFEVEEGGVGDTDFKLTAEVTENGIDVQVVNITGGILEYFKNLNVYPNPAIDHVNIEYRHLRSKDVQLQLIDMTGNVKWSQNLRSGFDGSVKVDVSQLAEGVYFLYFQDTKSSDPRIITYKILVNK